MKTENSAEALDSAKSQTIQTLSHAQSQNDFLDAEQELLRPLDAWQVSQQMAGRVGPTTEVGGMPVNDNCSLELEVEIMGQRANEF